MKKKAIILDRDGTLIVDKVYLNDPNEIEFLPGVFHSLRRLRDLGYLFFVATNQSGIARRLVTIANLNEIHKRIRDEFFRHGVDIKAFYYSPHSVESQHPTRKPSPGMLRQIEYDFGLDLTQSWMIGDRLTDVLAGHQAGCRTVLLEGVEDIPRLPQHPDYIGRNLDEASRFIELSYLRDF